MKLHEGAVKTAAQEIKLKRYLTCSVTDEQLVELAVTAYNEAKPDRSRPPTTGGAR